MAAQTGRMDQAAFASAVAEWLRQSRRRQRLTQSEVASRTGGVVSKAALANYETGHRSLRVEVFWAIAKALGEDPGTVLVGAERSSGYGAAASASPVTVDVAAVQGSTDPRLQPVRRWFALRLQRHGTRIPAKSITLDHGALVALAELMGVTPAECRGILAEVSGGANLDDAASDGAV